MQCPAIMSIVNGAAFIIHLLAFFFYDTACLGSDWYYGWWIFLIWLTMISSILVCCFICCMVANGEKDIEGFTKGLLGGKADADAERDNMDTTAA